MTSTGPLSLAREAIREARAALDQAGYAGEPILAELNVKDARRIERLPFATVLQSLGDEGIAPLIKLFALRGELSIELAQRALPLGLSFWEDLGLVKSDGDKAWASMRLQPDSEFMLASDWPAEPGADIAPDHVLGHNPTAALLDNITIREPVSSMLDLGTGCGIQALVASGHAGTVVATDINSRAVNIASFNALLNDAEVEVLEGDLFEPVKGRTFDLITSNPPFVISPQSNYMFRDSELGGEGIARRIISSAAEYLNEDGFCQMLCNLAHYKNQDWEAGIRAAFEGSRCDTWVLKVNEMEAAVYAASWIRSQDPSPERFQEELGEWLAFYEREGIEAITWAFVTMRKRSDADNWFALSEIELPLEDRVGDHVRRCFEGYGVLATHSPEALLDTKPRVSAQSRLEQSFAPEDGGWTPDSSRLATADGLPISGGVDAHVANMLVRCDGERTLREVFALSASDAEVPFEAMLPEALKITRRLFEGGHLIVD